MLAFELMDNQDHLVARRPAPECKRDTPLTNFSTGNKVKSRTLDVTASLNYWSAGAANRGWAFRPLDPGYGQETEPADRPSERVEAGQKPRWLDAVLAGLGSGECEDYGTSKATR
jgi:hypothetical protein